MQTHTIGNMCNLQQSCTQLTNDWCATADPAASYNADPAAAYKVEIAMAKDMCLPPT